MTSPILLADINPGENSSDPGDFVVAGSQVFFTAYAPEYGKELWRTDGTTEGTRLVKEIVSGDVDAAIKPFASLGEVCFFVVDDGVSGLNIWRSDGTQAGTYSLQIPVEYESISLESIAQHHGLSYFALDQDIWSSDGTLLGTKKIASGEFGVHFLGSFQESLLYRTYSEVKAISDAGEVSTIGGDVDYFYFGGRLGFVGANYGDDLYFLGASDEAGLEPWLIDGLTGNSRLIKDISFGTYDSNADWFTPFGDQVYFIANSDQLWATDGTADGTSLIKDLDPDYSYQEPSLVLDTGRFLAILLDYSLWVSDGTFSGTMRPSDVNPAFEDEYIWVDEVAIDANGYLYVNDWDRLWQIQAPVNGSVSMRFANIESISEVGVFGDLLLIAAENNSSLGSELWMLDISEPFPDLLASTGSSVNVGNASSSSPAATTAPVSSGTPSSNPSETPEASSTTPVTPQPQAFQESPVLGIQPQETVATVELTTPIFLGNLQFTRAVVGTNARDVVTGSDEAEALTGGKGRDRTTGGGGPDAFVFETPGEFGKQSLDVITDFDPGQGDQIVIASEAFEGVSKVKFTSVSGKRAARNAASSNNNFIYDDKKGILYFNENGKKDDFGDGGEFARLLGAPEMAKADIVIA